MREYELVIDEALAKGLCPVESPATNDQWLLDCLGFRCGVKKLEAHKTLSNPLPDTLNLYYSWPFPQFIVGEAYGVLVIRDLTGAEDYVYSVSEDHQTVTELFTVPHTLGLGTLMEIADFGEYIVMTNGVFMVYWDPETTTWQRIGDSPTIPNVRTICNFKGQAVGGNVVSDWYDCNETFYVWSKIGSIDFTPGNDNEDGYRRCPYGGEVYHTKVLGDVVIGYSSKGVTLIHPVLEPAATFGFKLGSDIGIVNQGAMAGDNTRHVYVGEDYIVREVTSEGIKELGYQSYLEALTGDIIVTYDQSKMDFYIGNSEVTFLLSPSGMTAVKQHPSAVWKRNKQVYMLPDTEDSESHFICTNIFDMTYRGQKTVFSMEMDALRCTGPEVAIDYANDLDEVVLGSYKPINNQGIAAIIVAGNEFRFRIKFSSISNNAKLSYLKARYKMTDLRGIRGVYAPPPRGQ